MSDDRDLIERLREALDKGARTVRPSAPPFSLVESAEQKDRPPARDASWRALSVAATALAITAAGVVALVVAANDDEGNGIEATATTTPTPQIESAGPGTIPSGPPDIDTVRFSTEPVRTHGFVLEADDGPQLCMGAVAASYPPQCGGPVITNWRWSSVNHETDTTTGSEARWGSYTLVGSYNEAGTAFTLTEPIESSTGGAEPTPSTLSREFSTPCPEPPGGWNSPWLGEGSTPTSVPPNPPQVEGIDRLAGFGGTWFDREHGVRNVRIVGGTEAEGGARTWLAERYEGPVCVVPSRYTEAQLRAVQDQISALNERTRSGAMTSWGVRTDAESASVYVEFGAPVPEFEGALRAHYGDLIVFEHIFDYLDGAPSATTSILAATTTDLSVAPSSTSLDPADRAVASPQVVRPGDELTVSPRGVIERNCNDVALVASLQMTNPSISGQLWPDGRWVLASGEVPPTWPACAGTQSADDVRYLIPGSLSDGSYQICLTDPQIAQACATFQVVASTSPDDSAPVTFGPEDGSTVETAQPPDTTGPPPSTITTTASSLSATTQPVSAGRDGPVIRHLPPFDGDEDDAEIRGSLQLEGDCLYVWVEEIDSRYPVVWPATTIWDRRSSTVILPKGDRLSIGDELYGSGGYLYVEAIRMLTDRDGAELAQHCVDNTYGEFVVVNNNPSAIGPVGS